MPVTASSSQSISQIERLSVPVPPQSMICAEVGPLSELKRGAKPVNLRFVEAVAVEQLSREFLVHRLEERLGEVHAGRAGLPPSTARLRSICDVAAS
jgi:hypothetical protein